MKLFIKLVLGAAAICVLLFIGWCILLASAFGAFDKQYTRQYLIDHYQSKNTEIKNLTTYYNSIVPAGKLVDVEFEDGSISMVSVEWEEGISRNYNKLWKTTDGTRAIDSLVHTLGWKQETLNQLEEKLEDADCISIKNGEPNKIGFQRSGMGMFFSTYSTSQCPIVCNSNTREDALTVSTQTSSFCNTAAGQWGHNVFLKIRSRHQSLHYQFPALKHPDR